MQQNIMKPEALTHLALLFREYGDALVSVTQEGRGGRRERGGGGGEEESLVNESYPIRVGGKHKTKKRKDGHSAPKTPSLYQKPPNDQRQEELDPNQQEKKEVMLLSLQDLGFSMEDLPTEILTLALAYTLRPKFIPEYVYDREAQVWVRQNTIDRQTEAIREITRLARAYGGMAVASTRFRSIVQDPHFRVQLYKNWLASPEPPLFLNANVEPPIQPDGFGWDAIRALFQHSVPELQNNHPSSSAWYSIYLANMLVNFHIQQYMYDTQHVRYAQAKYNEMVVVYGERGEDETIGRDEILERKYQWDGAVKTEAQLKASQILWPKVDVSGKNADGYVWTIQRSGTKAKSSAITKIATQLPGGPMYQVGESMDRYKPEFWINSKNKGLGSGQMGDSKFQRESPYYQLVSGALGAATVLRIPTLEVVSQSIMAKGQERASQRDNLLVDMGDLGACVLIWNKSLVWTKPVSMEESSYTFWPNFENITLKNLIIGNTDQTGRILSKLLAVYPFQKSYFERVLQSIQDPKMQITSLQYRGEVLAGITIRSGNVGRRRSKKQPISSGYKDLAIIYAVSRQLEGLPSYLHRYFLSSDLDSTTTTESLESDDDNDYDDDDDDNDDDNDYDDDDDNAHTLEDYIVISPTSRETKSLVYDYDDSEDYDDDDDDYDDYNN